MTQPGIEPQSPGPLVNNLLVMPMNPQEFAWLFSLYATFILFFTTTGGVLSDKVSE